MTIFASWRPLGGTLGGFLRRLGRLFGRLGAILARARACAAVYTSEMQKSQCWLGKSQFYLNAQNSSFEFYSCHSIASTQGARARVIRNPLGDRCGFTLVSMQNKFLFSYLPYRWRARARLCSGLSPAALLKLSDPILARRIQILHLVFPVGFQVRHASPAAFLKLNDTALAPT